MERTCARCGQKFEAARPAKICPACRSRGRSKPGNAAAMPDGAPTEEEEEFDDLLFGGTIGFFDDFLPRP